MRIEDCEVLVEIASMGGDDLPGASTGRGARERVLLTDGYFHFSRKRLACGSGRIDKRKCNHEHSHQLPTSSIREFKAIKLTSNGFATPR